MLLPLVTSEPKKPLLSNIPNLSLPQVPDSSQSAVATCSNTMWLVKNVTTPLGWETRING